MEFKLGRSIVCNTDNDIHILPLKHNCNLKLYLITNHYSPKSHYYNPKPHIIIYNPKPQVTRNVLGTNT